MDREECVHEYHTPTYFEESPNGDDGAWCIPSRCKKCGVIKIFDMGIGKLSEKWFYEIY